MTALRELRQGARLTGAELARRAGVWPATLWQWERGKQLPRAWTKLSRLADVLNTSVDSILGRVPLPAPVLDALAVEDRKLLDAMKADVEALLGPAFLRAAHIDWRYLARSRWLGHLFRIRDYGQPRPKLPDVEAVRELEDAAKRYRRIAARKVAI